MCVFEPMADLDQVLKMRDLAAQLRSHAAETSLQTFQRRFEAAAAELEQRALDVESRLPFRLAG